MGSGIGNTELRTPIDIQVFIMSFSRSNKGSVGPEQNVNTLRSPGFLASSLSKSAADKMMWSLWTMGEDDQSQEETDFKPEGKQVKNYSPAIRDQQEKNGSSGFSLKGHTDGERRGGSAESSSWGTGRTSLAGRGRQRKNSETIFNLEY